MLADEDVFDGRHVRKQADVLVGASDPKSGDPVR